MPRRKVRKVPGGRWLATCSCGWGYSSRELPKVHTEATFHSCRPVLGPRPVRPGTTIAAGTSTAVASVRDPRPSAGWWGFIRPREVW